MFNSNKLESRLQKPISKHLPGIGIILLFVGLLLLFLNRYGHQIAYTHTYYFISQLVSPTINYEMLLFLIMLAVQLLFFVFASERKFRLSERIIRRKRLRVGLKVVGGIIVIAALASLIAIEVFSVSIFVLLSKLQNIVLYLVFGAFGLVALTLAAFPEFIRQLNEQSYSWIYRLGAFGIAIVAVLLVIVALELEVMDPPDQQVLASQVSSQTNVIPTHYLFFTVSPHYRKLQTNESVPLDVVFKALDPQTGSQGGVSGSYPIALDPNHEYSVSINVRSVGFELEGPSEELLKPRPFDFNEEIRWTWLVSPKEGREGTHQNVIFEAFIHDITDNNRLVDSPYATVSIAVSTPLGLPAWLISPETGIGTIIGGFITLLVPWILGQISEINKEKRDKRRRLEDQSKPKIEVPKITLPDQKE